jgi:hypothetical protein
MRRASAPARARAREGRHERKRQLLGVSDPSCAVCGYDQVPSLVEAHHVAAEANQPTLVVAVCRNHHGELSDAAEDSLGDLRLRDADRDPLTRLAGLFGGLADFLRLLADQLDSWADWLLAAAAYLISQLGAGWWNALSVAVPL